MNCLLRTFLIILMSFVSLQLVQAGDTANAIYSTKPSGEISGIFRKDGRAVTAYKASQEDTMIETYNECKKIKSKSNPLLIPGKTDKEYQDFKTWASNNPDKVGMSDCYTGSWTAGSCNAGCGNSTVAEPVCSAGVGQCDPSTKPASGQACTNYDACTYAPAYAACPSSCGYAGGYLSPTSCTRQDGGTGYPSTYCSGSKYCPATASCCTNQVFTGSADYSQQCSENKVFVPSSSISGQRYHFYGTVSGVNFTYTWNSSDMVSYYSTHTPFPSNCVVKDKGSYFSYTCGQANGGATLNIDGYGTFVSVNMVGGCQPGAYANYQIYADCIP